MKKFLSILLASVLVLGLTGCGKDSTGGDKGSSTGNNANTLVVGTPELTGDYTNGWGNSSYDLVIKNLIHDYPTYATTDEGEFVLNETVVESLETSEDADGNKTFTFKIHNDLKWSDDTPITAKDYVFNVLFQASPAIVANEGTFSTGDSYVGYKEYHEGTSEVFKGVKLIDDYTFSLTVDKVNLPYFYEVAYVQVSPEFPMHVIMKDGDVVSDETGAKLTGDVNAAAKFVNETYRKNPTVTSGPYTFVSMENNIATVKLNPLYKGNFEGKKPTIENVVVRTVNQTLTADLVEQGGNNGGIDIASGEIEGKKIEQIKASDTASYSTYYRAGYGYLAFHSDFGPTADVHVRHAIAYLMDRNMFVQNVVGGYGIITNGDYGLSQWMYQENKEAVDSSLINFTYNVEKANEELDQSDYKYEADGTTPFDVSKAAEGYYRHNSKGEVLEIVHCGTTENPVTETVANELTKNSVLAGIKFSIDRTDFATMLDHFYKGPAMGADRKYHSFNLAVGFTPVFDPYYSSYHSDFLGTTYNATQTNDAELDALIEDMRRTDSNDKEGYAQKWLAYQIRWNEVLPVIPLYANQYFDFYNNRVKGLETTPLHDWSQDICDLSLE